MIINFKNNEYEELQYFSMCWYKKVIRKDMKSKYFIIIAYFTVLFCGCSDEVTMKRFGEGEIKFDTTTLTASNRLDSVSFHLY